MLEASHAPDPSPLVREADATLTEQLAGRFRERIRQRALAPGARLPSVRECAECGGELGRPLRFDARAQGFVCDTCATRDATIVR